MTLNIQPVNQEERDAEQKHSPEQKEAIFERMLEELRNNRIEERKPELAMQLARHTGFLVSARAFIEEQPVFYDKNRIWWLWNKTTTRWEITDETDILTIITDCLKLFGDVSVKSKNHLVEALKQEGRKKQPKEFPKQWVQFKERIYDLETENIYQASPEYFCVNPIPWKIGESEDTPTISKLFDEWVGPEYTQTLYELIAYHCYADYPIHTIFCLVGNGRNGKSKFQELIHRFIGSNNICSTELENIFENRFETFKLYKKLGCEMGETNFDTIRNTSLLKKLCGQSLIGYEAKNKDPFDDYNYAKIVISSNSLPTSEDTSDGFYRRWLIINFPNEFPEGKNIIDTIPLVEYENLARKITKILPEIIRTGKFKNQGTIEERRKRYIEASNPLMIFINEFCVEECDASLLYSSLYTKYVAYLNAHKRRAVSRKEFSEALERDGFEIKKTTINGENGRFIMGIRFKDKINDFGLPKASVPVVPEMRQVDISSLYRETNMDIQNIGHLGNTAPINAFYENEKVETTKICTATGILSFLREKAPKLVSFEEILNHVAPDIAEPSRWLMLRLEAMRHNGDVFDPKPDFWTVLQ